MLTIAAPPGPFVPWRAPNRLTGHGIAMGVSFACYAAGHVMNGDGGVETILNMIGAGSCGWAWLLARALFDPAKRDARWPRVVMLVLIASGALSVLSLPGGLGRIAANTYVLTGSAALLLTFFEPFHRYGRDLSVAERRFRFAFVVIYAALVAVSILAPYGPSLTAREVYRIDLINGLCALAGLITGLIAIRFRLRNPLAETTASRSMRREPTIEDRRLSERIVNLLHDERLHTETNLKVADVAARLGQPEYRISQCVSGVLGFENFNRLVNHHRIEHAKRLLTDTETRRSILDVAFDCGFGSVGPFNRAFKASTGVTPRDFRTTYRREVDHQASSASRAVSTSG